MKKTILIGIALIAMFATQVRATSYYPSDQLQTHSIVMQQSPVVFASFVVPATSVVLPMLESNFSYTKTQDPVNFVNPHVFAWIDPGSKINWKVNQNRIITELNPLLQIPITTLNKVPCNYNIDFSYGLRI